MKDMIHIKLLVSLNHQFSDDTKYGRKFLLQYWLIEKEFIFIYRQLFNSNKYQVTVIKSVIKYNVLW